MLLNFNKNDDIIIWDLEEPPPAGHWKIILWSAYEDLSSEVNCVSMPIEVERRADELRSAYLKWVFDLGEMQIGNKKLKDHMEIRLGLSYWWMTSIAQKCNVSKTSKINDILKAFALEKILISTKPKSIKIYSKNKKLVQVLCSLCKSLSLQHEAIKPNNNLDFCCYVNYNSLPPFFRAFLYLSWYISKSFPIFFKKKIFR